ncbi:hypothetical protein ACN9MF_17875 [Methylobacterium fujisawaense]|uniref:hypothetical protein n=1 Tax=Methylobacterium fujisawaense TaxID=107400 RepID=UPI003CEA45CD
MTDSNNPVEGTASLTLHDAASQISALFGNEETADAETPAVEAEVPSHEEADATEVHPETDTAEAEQPTEDAEPEAAEVPSFSDDTEVEVNGERVKVKDLKSGYLRQSDYTRKTQELATQRQQAESQVRTELNAQAAQYLANIEQALVDHFPQEPNWQQLAEENPAQWAVEREAWNKRVSDLQNVRQMRAQHEQAAHAQHQAAIAQAQAEAYNNLVQMHPEFARTADGSVSKASEELANFALNEMGFSKETLQGVTDAKVFSVLYDAMRYRRSQAQQPKALQAVANKPPLAKPGVTTGKATLAQTDHNKQMARLKRTGSVEDAASIISRLF